MEKQLAKIAGASFLALFLVLIGMSTLDRYNNKKETQQANSNPFPSETGEFDAAEKLPISGTFVNEVVQEVANQFKALNSLPGKPINIGFILVKDQLPNGDKAYAACRDKGRFVECEIWIAAPSPVVCPIAQIWVGTTAWAFITTLQHTGKFALTETQVMTLLLTAQHNLNRKGCA